MAEDTQKTDEVAVKIEKIEMSKSPATVVATKSIAAVKPVHGRIGSEPERLSKGQRRHIRRQKQAGAPKAIDRRQ